MKLNKISILTLAILLGFFATVGSVNAKLSKSAYQLYQKANTAECKGDMQEAINFINEAITANTEEDAMLYTKLGGLYVNIEKYDEALNAYNKAISLNSGDSFLYISIGNIYQLKNDYQNALNAYKKALQLCPEYKYNHLNIANTQLQLKQYTDAETSYNNFLEAYPDNIEALSNLAEAYFLNNKKEQSCELYKRVYESNPEGFKAFTRYGSVLFALNKYEEAVPILEKAVEQDSNSIKSLAELAISQQKLGNLDAAEEAYYSLFDLAPDVNEFRLDYANLLVAQGKNTKAIQEFNTYIQAYPNDFDAYANLGSLHKKLNNTDLAIQSLEAAYKLNPNDIDVIKDIAFCYHKNLDYDNALKYYDIALANDPDNYSVNYNKAVTLHALNRYNEAITSYEKLLSLKEEDVTKNNLIAAIIEQGYLYIDDQKYSDAINCFLKAVDLNTTEGSVYIGLATAYRGLGNNEKPLIYYKKAIDLEPKNQEFIDCYEEFKESLSSDTLDKIFSSSHDEEAQYLSLITNGDKQYKNKNYKAALEPYEKAYSINDKDKTLILKIGNIYKEERNLEKAGEYYKKAIALDEKYADAWFNLGLVYANLNNLNTAIECFTKVTAIDTQYTYAYYAMALAYEYQHNTQKAILNYKKYVSLEADKSMVNAINEKIKKLQK